MTLSFRLGPIPVRIHVWLLFLAMLLGMGAHGSALGVAVHVLGPLLTLFVHELAHAMVARSFGAAAEVDLTLFGGSLGVQLASLPSARRMVVCLAGPAVNLLAGAAAFGMLRAHPPGVPVEAWGYLGWINAGWGLLNLLPILPLDAGHAVAAALERPTHGRGEHIARSVSIGVAVTFGCAALAVRAFVPALLCTLLAFQNARAMRLSRERRNREAILRVHLGAAYSALERGQAALAITHCRMVLDSAVEPGLRRDAVRLLAYAYATSGDWARLIELLESGGVAALGAAELEKYQGAARELGRVEDAHRLARLGRRFA